MDTDINTLDWSLFKSFLAVADTGSLSGAARVLGQSQPTLGRQIKHLEDHLHLTLFDRHTRGFALTEAGAQLIAPARAMAEAAAQISLTAAGQEAQIAGTVRITASEVMARHALPAIIAGLRQQEPDIQIEIVPTDTSENLLFREADIAVRMYRSTQLDVITKHVADAPMGIYAAKSYIARKGVPHSAEDMLTHDLVGYDRDERILNGMHALGWDARRDWFPVRCDDQNTYWELVRQGCGIGFTQQMVASGDPAVKRILRDIPLEPLPVWLAAPEAMRSTPRIRRVWEALEAGLARLF
ncbi:MAG: LysR family transcriptional regulator [Pseudomonadota bacterium]